MNKLSPGVLLAAAHSVAAVWILAAPKTPRWRLSSLGMASREGPGFRKDGASLSRALASLGARHPGPAAERRRRAEVRELCFALADELRAGRTPPAALVRAVEMVTSELVTDTAGVLVAARTGGDVVAALSYAGSRPGTEGFRRLGACWQVGAGSGAGFALAVERLAGALRAEEQHRREVAAQLAGPRSTARLLAALPLLGLLMSAAMGMRPFGFLVGTPYGIVCLLLGLALDVVGVVWTGRLARAAEES